MLSLEIGALRVRPHRDTSGETRRRLFRRRLAGQVGFGRIIGGVGAGDLEGDMGSRDRSYGP